MSTVLGERFTALSTEILTGIKGRSYYSISHLAAVTGTEAPDN